MMLALGNQVRLMGFFGRQIVSKPVGFFVYCNVGSPFVLEPNHPKKTRFVAPVWSANVLGVAAQINDPQVAQPVVTFAPIYMVDNAVRPDAMRVQPSKSVRFVNFLFDAYRNVAKPVGYASSVANVYGFSGSRNPSKNSSVRVVVKKLSNFFSRNVVNHVCFPFVRFNVNAGIIA
jgi:hypothetical protein